MNPCSSKIWNNTRIARTVMLYKETAVKTKGDFKCPEWICNRMRQTRCMRIVSFLWHKALFIGSMASLFSHQNRQKRNRNLLWYKSEQMNLWRRISTFTVWLSALRIFGRRSFEFSTTTLNWSPVKENEGLQVEMRSWVTIALYWRRFWVSKSSTHSTLITMKKIDVNPKRT